MRGMRSPRPQRLRVASRVAVAPASCGVSSAGFCARLSFLLVFLMLDGDKRNQLRGTRPCAFEVLAVHVRRTGQTT